MDAETLRTFLTFGVELVSNGCSFLAGLVMLATPFAVAAYRRREADAVTAELGDLAAAGITRVRTQAGEEGVDVRVEGLPEGLAITPEVATDPWSALGDRAFDARYSVRLGVPHHLAWLDAEVRRAFTAERAALRLGGGKLRLLWSGTPSATSIRAARALADRLVDRDPAAVLAAMAASDPVAGLRWRAAGALAGLDPERARAVRLPGPDPVPAALLAQDPEALRAALAGATPRQHVDALVSARGSGRPALLRGALAALADADDAALGLAFPAAADAVAALGDGDALRDLLRLFERAPESLVARWAWLAAPALEAAPPDPTVEAWCAALAGHAGDRAWRLLGWLERHGTVASVPALRALEDAGWDLQGAGEHARRARRAIQARAGVGRGEVSLAEGGAGELAVAAEAERGALASAPLPVARPRARQAERG